MSIKIIDISIIGTGNVAWHLCTYFLKNPAFKIELWGRKKTLDILEAFPGIHQYKIIEQGQTIRPKGALVFLAVNDDALEEMIDQISCPQSETSIILHTSGSKSAQILRSISSNYGSLWPVQSLTKGVLIDKLILGLTASNDFVIETLEEIFDNPDTALHLLEDEKKQKLHVAAVFANNFTNHIYTLVKDYCTSEDLEFSILDNLILQNAVKVTSSLHPKTIQTGPAIRHDQKTIVAHLQLLKDHEDLKELYVSFTKKIQNYHK